MKTPAIAPTFRHPLVAVCLCLVVLALAAPARAGDPDDDWGLPKTTGSPAGDVGGGGKASSATAPGDVAVHGETIEGELDAFEAALTVDRVGAEGSELVGVSEAVDADVLVADGAARVAPLADGAQLQGDLRLRLGGALSATLHAAKVATARAAFLVVEGAPGAGSLGHLLDGAAGGAVPAAVVAVQDLGALDELDVDGFSALVEQYADALAQAGVGHVSIVMVSRDYGGALRSAGVRVPVAGGDVEVETR